MFSAPTRLLAMRYLRSRRKEGFISVIALFSILGIMLGVATLILVTSLMNGIRLEMMDNFVGIEGHVTVYGQGSAIVGTTPLIENIRTLDGVKRVTQRIEGQVMASSSGRALGAQVIGTTSADIAAKPKIANTVDKASLTRFDAGEGVLVGERLLQNLGLKVGQSMTLISPQGRATFAGMVPRLKAYPILGTFKLGMQSLDSSLILMPYEDARVYFTLPEREDGSATAIEIEADTLDDAQAVAHRIASSIGPGYRVYDWQQSNQGVFNALKIQRDVMVIILALIILVAAFNIISSLIMLVKDKKKDIGILRAMGASRGMVLQVFLLTGVGIGLIGTLLGFGLGLLAAENLESLRLWLEQVLGYQILAENIYFLSSLPTKTDPVEVSFIVGLSLLLSFLAALYPAWRAASQHPAEVLRYE